MTPSCPLLVFKQSSVDGSLQLVATGNLLSIDPDRIMLKKIILTGNPVRVRKRTGVIKHMFYDPLVSTWLLIPSLTNIMVCLLFVVGCQVFQAR